MGSPSPSSAATQLQARASPQLACRHPSAVPALLLKSSKAAVQTATAKLAHSLKNLHAGIFVGYTSDLELRKFAHNSEAS